MRPRVTAILVASNGAGDLRRTIEAIAGQSRNPDAIVTVDLGSTDGSLDILSELDATHLTASRGTSFGAAVMAALTAIVPEDDDWLWLLDQDCAPDPSALADLVGAVEVAPSVSIAGPKRMRWSDDAIIHRYGQSVTRLGRRVELVDNELDQGQHDVVSDVLAVEAGGMLVRRSLFLAIGGFDPRLPTVDAGLDLCIRARLAGTRVAVVPTRVASKDSIALTQPRRGEGTAIRRAELHRRMVYAPAIAVPFHWLSLVPLALVRSLWQIIDKRPWLVGAELAAAFGVAFSGSAVPTARRRLASARALGWASIAALRMPYKSLRQRRHDERGKDKPGDADTVGFVTGGGLLAAIAATAIGLLFAAPVLGTGSVNGGATEPLGTLGALWDGLSSGWRAVGLGSAGPADPFNYVLALFGSLWPASPSVVIVMLYAIGLGLASIGAWFAARRLTDRPQLIGAAALLWAVGPMFLSALGDGRIGGVITHILLPWLFLATFAAARSWSASGFAALLFAAIAASSPSLVPALLLLWVVWLIVRIPRWMRLIGIPIPAIVLSVPLVWETLARGTPFALLADPGVPFASHPAPAWQLALGFPSSGLGGLVELFARFSVPEIIAPIAIAVLLAPLGLTALSALVLPSLPRAIPLLLIALLGFLTAVASSLIGLTHAGTQVVFLWPGSGLSLYWLGLLGAAVAAMAARPSPTLASLTAVGAGLAALPLILALIIGTAAITPGDSRRVPALVAAEAQDAPSVGTMVITPQADGGILVEYERGAGDTLDVQSTYVATSPNATATQGELGQAAANLVSLSSFDGAALSELNVGFVLLAPAAGAPTASDEASDRYTTAEASLDSSPLLASVSETVMGRLWRTTTPTVPTIATPDVAPPWLGRVLIAQLVIVIIAALIAVPTTRRRKRGADRD